MNRLSLLFESPPWLIGVGMVIGAAYALLLYFRIKTPWSREWNYGLAMLRFLMVTQLTLLLFGPLIRQIKNTKEPPSVVLAVDNSESIAETSDSTALHALSQRIFELREKLMESGYITEIRTFDGVPQTGIEFSSKSSNINTLLEGIRNDYESRNLANVVLFSDGLYNSGSNPSFRQYNFDISTVGLGDTVQHPDINLNALIYNKIVYQGNSFPIVAEVFTKNLTGKTATVRLMKNQEILESKTITIRSSNQYNQVQFVVPADESGMQRYTVSATPEREEHIISNNTKDAFVDIVDGKQKILFVAAAPHPDIKALKNALEANKNYEVVIYIEGIFPYKDDKYDAVILHQIPNRRRQYEPLLAKISNEKWPVLFLYGSQTDINAFNAMNGCVTVIPINIQFDNVLPKFNTSLNSFLYSDENLGSIDAFSPVKVPFANYKIVGSAEVVLYQQVGKIVTEKPLLLVQRSTDWTSAVMLGDGMWNWRMQEFAKTQSTRAFDEMVTKVVQFISTREDKRKFRVYPLKNELLNNEPVIFEAEVYNDIYERTYNHKIDLQISREDGSLQNYTYVTSEQNSSYHISGLPEGIYSYNAAATIGNKKETAGGTFMIRDLQLESTNLTADHNLLKNIAREHEGTFYLPDDLGRLNSDLIGIEKVFKIYSSEKYLSIIQLKWAFFILILFVSAEWFLRKYLGGY